jgi:hypothetical protein
MTFIDLPPDWRRRPLTDLALATDVVDLYCTAGDRSRGALTLIICDEKDRFKGALVVDLCDLIPDPPSSKRPAASTSQCRTATATAPPGTASSRSAAAALPAARATSRSISRVAALRPVIRPLQVYPGGALILALGRRGPSVTTTSDREWAEAAARVCKSLGVRLLGFYLASRETVFPADLTTSVADLPSAA